MNKLIIGNMNYGKEKNRLNINKHSFDEFLNDLVSLDYDRSNFSLAETVHGRKIAKTIECFEVEFTSNQYDTFYISDLQYINDKVFDGSQSDLDVLLWISKGISESIGEMLDENIRYGGGIDTKFLEDLLHFITKTYISCPGYKIVKIN